MASIYQQVGYGSSGETVKKLQNLLNLNGYALDEDGIFGELTKAAVRDYQKKNNLLLDGIAGEQTWGSLLSAGTQQTIPVISTAAVTALKALGKGLLSSYETQAARAQQKSLEEAKPEAYRSDFEEELKALYDQIAEREDFRYDPAEDATYQGYAKQYQRQGKQAMEDTMGKAVGLTGGYASSYAENAAQQAYENYLAKLQDVVPALQENAWQRYKAQGEELLQRYNLLKQQDNEAYERWQNEVTAWQKAVDAAQKGYGASTGLEPFQMLLDYFADKAASVIKTVKSGAESPAAAVSSIGNTSALSSTASDSLKRAMKSYLKNGKPDVATALYEQYKDRMTPNQRKNFGLLLDQYGVTVR